MHGILLFNVQNSEKKKRVFRANSILLFLIAILLMLNSCQDNDKPFKIKDINLLSQSIPYESMKTESFYEDYLKPLMLQIGFREEDSYFVGTDSKKKKEMYSDGSLFQNESGSCARFKIPNSRYEISFGYEINWISEGDHAPWDDGVCPADSYYSLGFCFIDTNDRSSFGSVNVFSDFSLLESWYEWDSRDTYSGYDSSKVIFSQERTTNEIYEKLKEAFDDPKVKEKLLIEQQVRNK